MHLLFTDIKDTIMNNELTILNNILNTLNSYRFNRYTRPGEPCPEDIKQIHELSHELARKVRLAMDLRRESP